MAKITVNADQIQNEITIYEDNAVRDVLNKFVKNIYQLLFPEWPMLIYFEYNGNIFGKIKYILGKFGYNVCLLESHTLEIKPLENFVKEDRYNFDIPYLDEIDKIIEGNKLSFTNNNLFFLVNLFQDKISKDDYYRWPIELYKTVDRNIVQLGVVDKFGWLMSELGYEFKYRVKCDGNELCDLHIYMDISQKENIQMSNELSDCGVKKSTDLDKIFSKRRVDYEQYITNSIQKLISDVNTILSANVYFPIKFSFRQEKYGHTLKFQLIEEIERAGYYVFDSTKLFERNNFDITISLNPRYVIYGVNPSRIINASIFINRSFTLDHIYEIVNRELSKNHKKWPIEINIGNIHNLDIGQLLDDLKNNNYMVDIKKDILLLNHKN